MQYLQGDPVRLSKEELAGTKFFIDKRGDSISVQVMLKDGRCFGFDTTEKELLASSPPSALSESEELISPRAVFPCVWAGGVSKPLGLVPGMEGCIIHQVEAWDLDGRIYTVRGNAASIIMGFAEMGYRAHPELPTPDAEIRQVPLPGSEEPKVE